MLDVKKKNVFGILYNALYLQNKDEVEIDLDALMLVAIEQDDYSFDCGLLGLGWLITFLVQLEYFELDVEEVLYDFDDNMYKLAMKAIADRESQIDHLFELIVYFQQRLQSKINYNNFYRRFSLYECLRLLIEKLTKTISEDQISIFQLSKVSCKMSYLIKTCLNEREIEVIYYDQMEFLISCFEKKSHLTELETQALCYTLLSANQYKNPFWEMRLEHVLHSKGALSEEVRFLIGLNDIGFNEKIDISTLDFTGIIEKDQLLFFVVTNVAKIHAESILNSPIQA